MEASYTKRIVRRRSRFSHPLAAQNSRVEDGTISLEELFEHDKQANGIIQKGNFCITSARKVDGSQKLQGTCIITGMH